MVVPNASFYSANMAAFSVVDQIHHKMYRMSMCLLKVPLSRPALKSCVILLLAGMVISCFIFCEKYARFFKPVLPFGDLLFIHASTNATDNHKYSPFPSQILTVRRNFGII